MKRKRYPIGLQDFEGIRKGDFLYIDKTQLMYQFASEGTYFFLSRPRRFGKSLLLSTLKYFFLGRRDLFEGLWVDQHAEHDWATHPVIHLSLSTLSYKDLGLEAAFHQALNVTAEQYGLTLSREGLGQRFSELLQKLATAQGKVVVLIDEYDKPLIDYFDDPPQAQANREVMKNFFSILKDADPYLRFVFITGVSKFSKVSLFSDLNNLNDLTLHPRYATLTGYTPEEMDHYFGDQYPALATANEMGVDEVKREIQHWYNGYQWDIGKPVYNPFSVLRLFDAGRFANYWWETGTPTLLLKALEKDFQFDLQEVEAGTTLFESYTLESLDWKNLLFQTGYLTLKAFDRAYSLYTLSPPNREVALAMSHHLLATYRQGYPTDTQVLYVDIKRALDAGDMEKLIQMVDRLFSTIPYPIFLAKKEAFFHAILHITFQGLGLLTQSEVSRAQGRVDTLVHAESGIYVMEFKLDASAKAALNQIREKRYGSPHLGQGKPVIAIGISFSSETKTVAEWETMPYEELLAKGV